MAQKSGAQVREEVPTLTILEGANKKRSGAVWGSLTRRGSATWPVWGFPFVVTGTSPKHVAHVVPNHGNSLGGVYSSSKQVPIVACPLEKADVLKGVPTRTEVAMALTAATPPRPGARPPCVGQFQANPPYCTHY